MRVGVKYCGGCNPRYDRASIVARLKSELGDDGLEWVNVSTSEGRLDFVLVVCGCMVACAAHENLNGKQGKFIICAQEQYALALEHLKRLRQGP